MFMFTPAERATIRSQLLERAASDQHITGAAITGSTAAGSEDRWSDVDLAFGVMDAPAVQSTLADWTSYLYETHHAIHHVDVPSGAWIYRVFLLPGTLQVDPAFVPAPEFRALAPSFKLIHGTARESRYMLPPSPENSQKSVLSVPDMKILCVHRAIFFFAVRSISLSWFEGRRGGDG